MQITLIVIFCLLLVAAVVYYIKFPGNTFISTNTPEGATITFSRTGISYSTPPDHIPENGFDHIEPYVSQLLLPCQHFKSLLIFTPDGIRGFGFHARNGKVEVSISVFVREIPEREKLVRDFFSSLGITPSLDYLAANGGIPESTRCLKYPVQGNASEVTVLTRRILEELCSVSPSEAINIKYTEN